MTNRAPLIVAILLLLLPVLYVGGYFALVCPQGILVLDMGGPIIMDGQDANGYPTVAFARHDYYAWKAEIARVVFWPLEQIDRTVRPRTWR